VTVFVFLLFSFLFILLEHQNYPIISLSYHFSLNYDDLSMDFVFGFATKELYSKYTSEKYLLTS